MNNEPAFPRPYSEDAFLEDTDYLAQDGMTLRDYFAAKALLGLLIGIESGKEHQAAMIPKIAYDMADAMLKAREA